MNKNKRNTRKRKSILHEFKNGREKQKRKKREQESHKNTEKENSKQTEIKNRAKNSWVKNIKEQKIEQLQ